MSALAQQARCDRSYLEKWPTFDLGYVEFSDRGNLFSRERVSDLLSHVETAANEEAGVAVVVFVHGWNHNASPTSGNVVGFRRMLERIGQRNSSGSSGVVGKRQLVGLFVGWRGASVKIPLLKRLTYWRRKAVASKVGGGGLTELISRLNAVAEQGAGDNVLLVVGHSFGGAAVISAVNDLVADRMIGAKETTIPLGLNVDYRCRQAESFTDGIVLLNPAVEANAALQLVELSFEHDVLEQDFCPNQKKLMHVLSSDGDTATRSIFRVAQKVSDLVLLDQEDLMRRPAGKSIVLREENLDQYTVGNTPYFRTGRLMYSERGSSEPWDYRDCDVVGNEDICWEGDPADQRDNRFPRIPNAPFSFIRTDHHFMEDHNDFFNCNVGGYVSAIVAENLTKRLRYAQVTEADTPWNGEVPPECAVEDWREVRAARIRDLMGYRGQSLDKPDFTKLDRDLFDFGNCFAHFREYFRGLPGDKNRICAVDQDDVASIQ